MYDEQFTVLTIPVVFYGADASFNQEKHFNAAPIPPCYHLASDDIQEIV